MPSADRVMPDRDYPLVVARIGTQVVDVVSMFVQMLVVGFAPVALVQPNRAESARGLFLFALLRLPLYGGLLEGY